MDDWSRLPRRNAARAPAPDNKRPLTQPPLDTSRPFMDDIGESAAGAPCGNWTSNARTAQAGRGFGGTERAGDAYSSSDASARRSPQALPRLGSGVCSNTSSLTETSSDRSANIRRAMLPGVPICSTSLRLWSWELWPGCDSTAPVRHRDRGVEVVVDSLGGPIPLRSFRAACAAGCSATAGPSSAGVGACLRWPPEGSLSLRAKKGISRLQLRARSPVARDGAPGFYAERPADASGRSAPSAGV